MAIFSKSVSSGALRGRSYVTGLLACVAAFTACNGQKEDNPAQSDETGHLATTATDKAATLELDGARWSIHEPPGGRYEAMSLDEPSYQSITVSPVVSTTTGLQAHLLGAPLDSNISRAEIESLPYILFQEVPGVPRDPRYEGGRFDIVRNGFTSGCRDAVTGYQSFLAKALFNTEADAIKDLRGTSPLRLAGSYEDECLTQLDAVPFEIRRVLGVLSVAGVPFCSATIVDSNKLITSRHCLVDADTGIAKNSVAHWQDGNLAFIAAELHDARRTFKVAEPSAQELARLARPFSAADDYWLLETTRQFTHMANYVAAPDETAHYPVLTWLVGTNINVGDFGTPRTPLQFVRGSAPTACAILERTDAGCVYHTCQSSPATSGAGIFDADVSNGVRLLGVHKGTIVEAGSCETSPPLALQLNMGITDLVL